MAEYDILMQQENSSGELDQYYPIAKAFTLMTNETLVPVKDRKNYRLYGLVVADYTSST